MSRLVDARTRDEERSVDTQHPRDLGHEPIGVRDVLERLERADDVERLGGEVECERVHRPELDVRPGVAGACVLDRSFGDVDADDATCAVGQESRSIPDAATDVEHFTAFALGDRELVAFEVVGDDSGLGLIGDDALRMRLHARSIVLSAARPLDVIVPSLLGATIVTMGLASSGVPALRDAGRLRWPMLAALAALAAVWALGRPGRLGRPPLLALAAFLALALTSTTWSVLPGLTLGRTVSLILVFAAAVGMAIAVADRRELAVRLADAILAAAVVLAAGGVGLLALDVGRAVQSPAGSQPALYRGLGENPYTVSMLLAFGLPLALAAALRPGGRARRAAAAFAFMLFFGSIVLSGSDGAWAAGLVGAILVIALVPGSTGWRLVAVAGLIAAFAVARVTSPSPPINVEQAVADARASPGRTAGRGYFALSAPGPGGCRQEDELGRPLPGRPSSVPSQLEAFGSGRGQAWKGALEQIGQRPLLGYGFGTEDRVFKNCFYVFEGARPENSYLGLALQLGTLGLGVFAAAAGAIALAAARAVTAASRIERAQVAGLAGAVLAGAALGLVQSYFYAAGNLTTLALWTCALLLVGLAPRRSP